MLNIRDNITIIYIILLRLNEINIIWKFKRILEYII